MNHRIVQRLSVRFMGAAMGATLLILFISVPAARAQAQQPTNPAPPGNVEKGKKAFEKYGCFACHGYSGDGGLSIFHSQGQLRAPRPDVTGARLATNPRPFPSFVSYVRKPGGRMPAYGNRITEAEMADMYAFLKSLPASPDPKSIPLLNED